jgi:hypothetical protein
MLWSLNLVLKATVRGARDSRVTLLIGLCWHQARPTSTKAAVAHFSPPGPAGPGVHKHFHPLRAGPPGRMITLMDVAVLKSPVGARRSRPPAGDQLPNPPSMPSPAGSAPDFGRCSLDMAVRDHARRLSSVHLTAVTGHSVYPS